MGVALSRMSDEPSRVPHERDLCWQLLELGSHEEIEPFLEQALGLFLELLGARRGYIELDDPRADGASPAFSRGLADEALVPGAFSRRLMAEVLASGETVVTGSAVRDPRFQDHGSVRAGPLQTLCTPIGRSPVIGVVYLEDRVAPAPFGAEDRRRAEALARHVGSFAERLLECTKATAIESDDPTLQFRKNLRADALVGSSDALAHVLEQVSLVAELPVSVLLTGPSGAGKRVLARVIHDNSSRASGPFVELDCARLPEDTLERELFAQNASAHSTAHARLPGKKEAAQGGTLFLAEVCELPLHQQAKLLQLLQSGTYRPLGDAQSRQANVRIIGSTSVEPESAIADRRLREDLYRRLSAFSVRLPSLSERRSDIAALVRHFCESASRRNGFAPREPSPGALRALQRAELPGNVRELAHLVEVAALRAHAAGSAAIERAHLFPSEGRPSQPETLTFHEATRAFQRTLLCETLSHEAWNVTAAARALDLTRAHVYNLMAALGIQRPREAVDG